MAVGAAPSRPATGLVDTAPSTATSPESGGRSRRPGPAARGRVRHHQAVERRAGVRLDAAALSRRAEQARHRQCRPVPDPLAAARARTNTSRPGGPSTAPEEGRPARSASPTSARAPAADRRRDRRRPRSTRSSCTPLPAGPAARLPLRARDRHRGLEPARPGLGTCSTTRRSPPSPAHDRTPRPGDPALAPPGRRGAHPQIDPPRPLARTSTSSASRWTTLEMAALCRLRPRQPARGRPRRLRGDVARATA